MGMAVIVEVCGIKHIVRDRAAWLIRYLVEDPELVETVNRTEHGKMHVTWGGGDMMEMWSESYRPKRRRPE